LTLAGYASKDGSNAHPGVERLANDLCRGPRAVRYTLAALEEAGWITAPVAAVGRESRRATRTPTN